MDEVEASAIVGSAEEVADYLDGFAGAGGGPDDPDGVDLVVCRIGYDQPPRSAMVEVIERIGTELVPLVGSTTTGPGLEDGPVRA